MKRLVKLMLILLFVWGSMLFGNWLIWEFIVPLDLPNRVFSGVAKVGLGISLALFWLWMWRMLADNYFWSTIKRLKGK
jgi:hypothetical protein